MILYPCIWFLFACLMLQMYVILPNNCFVQYHLISKKSAVLTELHYG